MLAIETQNIIFINYNKIWLFFQKNFCTALNFTMIQQHLSGSSSFNQNWTMFKLGFGNTSADYWIGNDRLNILTKSGLFRLYVELQATDQLWSYVWYNTFIIGNESTGYQLQVGGYSGSGGGPGNSLASSGSTALNGMKFSTMDVDNDQNGSNCAISKGGGFWYNSCTAACVNCAGSNFVWNNMLSGHNNLMLSRMYLILK